jgi:hypothetical protein
MTNSIIIFIVLMSGSALCLSTACFMLLSGILNELQRIRSIIVDMKCNSYEVWEIAKRIKE